MVTKEALISTLHEMERNLKANRREADRYPEGRIRVVPRNGKIEYQHITKDEVGNEIRVGITKDAKLVAKLARKEYLEKESIILRKNVSVLKATINEFSDEVEKATFDTMKGNFKLIPEELYLTPPLRTSARKVVAELKEDGEYGINLRDGFISTEHLIQLWHSEERYLLRNEELQHKWAESYYEKSTYMLEELKHMTVKGFKVRSKSEALLTGILDKLKRPLHYEEVIRINGKLFIPDFTVLDKNGKVVFIEHFGRTFDEEYMKKRREKLESYEQAGIVPWDNFIATYEDENGNIDIRRIEEELRAKLL